MPGVNSKPKLVGSVDVSSRPKVCFNRIAFFALVFTTIFFYCVIFQSMQSYSSIEEQATFPKTIKAKTVLEPIRISAHLYHKLPLHGLHADGTDAHYRCQPGETIQHFMYHKWGGPTKKRLPLQGVLNASGVLDSHIKLKDFDLNLFIVGNSLSEQLHVGLEEALCFPLMNNKNNLTNRTSTCTTIFVNDTEKAWVKSPRLVHSKKGGLLAHASTHSLIDVGAASWKLSSPTIQKLLRAFQEQQQNLLLDDFSLDTFIFQFPSGHVDYANLELKTLHDVVQASQLFNARSVLFPTIAWNNNIQANKVKLWREKNELIRLFATNYTRKQGSIVETVQVLDFATLSENLLEANSKALALDSTDTYTLRIVSRWKNLVAQACGSKPFPADPKGCLANGFSVDGMHWCPETVHGRLNAGLVCILGCIHNHGGGHKNITTCSNQCNSKYMGLEPFFFDPNGTKLVA